MFLKAQVLTSELRCHKKKRKKISPTPSTSKAQVRTCGVNFGKIKVFASMVLKAQVWTCELCGHEKNFLNPLDIEFTCSDLWRQFQKNQNFCFYGPKGTGVDL